MAQHVILATGGVPLIIKSEATGHSYAADASVWTEGLAADQAFVAETIAAPGGVGVLSIAASPLQWQVPWATDGEPVVMRSGTNRAVAIPGAVVRGIGPYLQHMTMVGATTMEVIPTPQLARSLDRAWCVPVAGVEAGVMRGRGGYRYCAAGILVAFEGAFDQLWSLAGIAATGVAGSVNLVVGRVSWALGTSGAAPADPIYVLS